MKRRLMRHHINKEHNHNGYTPWRPSRSVKRIFLRQRYQRWQPWFVTTRKPMYKDQKHNGCEHEVDLKMVHEALNLWLIVDVPSEPQEDEKNKHEEYEVDRHRELSDVLIVWHVVIAVVVVSSHVFLGRSLA